jgi:RND family efflux transporter MFP subunit
LRPWHEAIVASEIDGLRVTDVLVDVGSVVSKGQPLAILADDSLRAELRSAEAALASAEVELGKARTKADRARKVERSGALSDEKINEYLIAEEAAVAGVEAAQASLQSRKIRLAQATIAAPDDGLITSRSIQLGAVVSSGTELFRLIRQQRVEWQAELSARYLPRVREGLAATLAGPDRDRIDGTVRLVNPTVSTDTGRAIAYIALPPQVRLPVGLYVTGQIELEKSSALTVPDTAVVLRDGIAYLFTVDANKRVSRIRVETGRRNDREVEILSGLDPSAEVVTTGGGFLSDKAVVRVKEDALVQLEDEAR